MPISSSAAATEKKRYFRLQAQVKSSDKQDAEPSDAFLTIESALPPNEHKRLSKRSHSTLNASSLSTCDSIILQTHADGFIHIIRTANEKECSPDRISLDRRGLNIFPIIDGEMRLRLLSLQHNLISNLEGLKTQHFPFLVFLDIYDNQLEQMENISTLENLRVLLIGKNRLKKIEGLESLKKIEVLDLHGNQISNVTGLSTLTELKVLNLAGNQIRFIGVGDFQGLNALQELNLRRNRLRKLLGFGETPNLLKLFISNNDLQSVEDISSLAKSTNLKEISIDNNPVFLSGDCISFLVSYLHQLSKLNTMQVTDQVRKAAMAWRRNKESTNTAFMDLTSDVCLNVRREEIISNARTNWELLRSQTRCLTAKSNNLQKNASNLPLSVDSDLILTSLGKGKTKTYNTITTKVPLFTNKKLMRTNSQDTDNTSSSNTGSSEGFVKLPPILVPIIKKMEQRTDGSSKEGSLSSVGNNIDSSASSLATSCDEESTDIEEEEETEVASEVEDIRNLTKTDLQIGELAPSLPQINDITVDEIEEEKAIFFETSSNISTISNTTNSFSSDQTKRNIKSANSLKTSTSTKWAARSTTAKPRKQSPLVGKDREQGGDYLIEICGRYLNVYGQCALRFIDKQWNSSKANDVSTVKFNYVNFNGITSVLNKLKIRFPNIDHFCFKETNIYCLGQLNALAEVQGLISLTVDSEGNPITLKNWRSYAIYRLSHWGLSTINGVEVTENEIKQANSEFQSLSDLVLWSLPEVLLQPLLVRLRLDVNYGLLEQNAKKWLLRADPDLKSVVSKEALQWKKGGTVQDDATLRQKAKEYMSQLLEEMSNSVNKLRLLDKKWPHILHEFVRNALLDYSQLDMYMKQNILELK